MQVQILIPMIHLAAAIVAVVAVDVDDVKDRMKKVILLRKAAMIPSQVMKQAMRMQKVAHIVAVAVAAHPAKV